MNSPVNFNDPTGHMCSDPDDPTPSCDGSGTPLPNTTSLPDDEVYTPSDPLDDGLDMGDDNDAGQGERSMDVTNPNLCAIYGECLLGPPSPVYDIGVLDNTASSNILHPFDILLSNKNTFGAYIPVYSLSGELIGFRVARYSPDYLTTRIDTQAINLGKYIKIATDNIMTGQLEKLLGLVGSKTMFSMAKKLSVASTVYDVASVANELVIINGDIEISGSMIVYSQNVVDLPSLNLYFGIPVP